MPLSDIPSSSSVSDLAARDSQIVVVVPHPGSSRVPVMAAHTPRAPAPTWPAMPAAPLLAGAIAAGVAALGVTVLRARRRARRRPPPSYRTSAAPPDTLRAASAIADLDAALRAAFTRPTWLAWALVATALFLLRDAPVP